jgi:hypothetical protein
VTLAIHRCRSEKLTGDQKKPAFGNELPAGQTQFYAPLNGRQIGKEAPVKASFLLGVAALLAALATSGCSAGASPRPEIELNVHAAPIWVRPNDVDHYVCTDGLFVCDDVVGRTSQRLCRCVAP